MWDLAGNAASDLGPRQPVTLTTVTVRILGGVDEVDVGDAAAADATEAVAPKTPVCDIVLVTEDGPEPIRNVTVAVPALRGLVETAGLAVHSPPPEYGFRALEGAKASDNENV
jgi:hypothetical protein